MLVQGINTGSGVCEVGEQSFAGRVTGQCAADCERVPNKSYLPTCIIPLSYIDYTLERRKQGRVKGEGEGREESILGRVSCPLVVNKHLYTHSK